MRKQKAMLPEVSMRALPDGKRRGSTRLTARLQRINVRLLLNDCEYMSEV